MPIRIKAWLVLACDLPFLDRATLQHLIAQRASARLATAYRSSSDGQPEPLCAIFEPAQPRSHRAVASRRDSTARARCCRRSMSNCWICPIRARSTTSTPREEYAAAQRHAALTPDGAGRRRAATERALFRAAARTGRPQYRAAQTQARTPRELYEELRRRRGLTLAPEFLRVAVNDEFGDWHAPLADGDTVVFLPPVAGG